MINESSKTVLFHFKWNISVTKLMYLIILKSVAPKICKLFYSGALYDKLKFKNCAIPFYVEHQSVTKIISLIILNLVTPKAVAKHELLINEPASGAKR